MTQALLDTKKFLYARITGMSMFRNLAGIGISRPGEVDCACIEELESAGIEWFNTKTRYGETHTKVSGALKGWTFHRAWKYWIANGPALPMAYASLLHQSHGTSVRVNGHCGCPSPEEYPEDNGISLYHIDTQVGLVALANAIRTAFQEKHKP